MMAQGPLPFQYLEEKTETNLTSFSGLPLYLDMAIATGLCTEIIGKLKTKTRGWHDIQVIMSLIMLNLAGGSCVDDIERLEADEGLPSVPATVRQK